MGDVSLPKGFLEKIDKLIDEKYPKYSSRSHLIAVAIKKLIEDENNG